MPTTLDNYINGGAAAGNAMAQRRAQDQMLWADMLKMVNANTPQTMLGYGLGKLLRGAWDHRKRRAAQKDAEARNAQGYKGGATPSEPWTIAGMDPDSAVDLSRTISGITPTQGLLGNSATLGQVQTTQEVQKSNGDKEKVTTTAPYTIAGPSFAEQVGQAANGMQGLTLEDLMKNPNAYYGYR